MSGKDKWTHRHKVIIASYGLLSNFFKNGLIKPGHFKCIIVDESHMIKSITTKRTQAILPLILKAKRRLLLSGTPALSKPAELFTQITCIADRKKEDEGIVDCANSSDPFLNHKAFKERYCKRVSGSHKEELYASLASVMIRRLKKDQLKSLPPKRRRHINIDLDEGELARKIATNMDRLRDVSKGMMNKLANELRDKRIRKVRDGARKRSEQQYIPQSSQRQETRPRCFSPHRFAPPLAPIPLPA